MNNGIKKWLWLKGYVVFKVKESGGNLEVFVRPRACYRRCPKCHGPGTTCHKVKPQRRILHALWGSHAVYLVGRRNQRKCLNCKKVFTEHWPGVKKWSRMSQKAQKDVLQAISHQSLGSVERYGISQWKARYLLQNSQVKTNWSREYRVDSFSLGIDEHSFRGKDMAITISNVTHHLLKDILPNDRQATLESYLTQIPEDIKSKIREACIDMKRAFLHSIKRTLPKAKVVIDPFHVIQDANRRLDEARRLEQEMGKERLNRFDFLIARERLRPRRLERLQGYLEKYPTLRPFYWIKEQLRKMYRADNLNEAKSILRDIIQIYEFDEDPEIEQWIKTLKYWRPYIINHFIHRTTNAFTEGMHTKIKLIKRLSYGFSNVQMYIKKMLLACAPMALIFHGLKHTFC